MHVVENFLILIEFPQTVSVSLRLFACLPHPFPLYSYFRNVALFYPTLFLADLFFDPILFLHQRCGGWGFGGY